MFILKINNIHNKKVYFETTKGFWNKRVFDIYNREISFIDSNEFWLRVIYDENGKKIYYGTGKKNISRLY